MKNKKFNKIVSLALAMILSMSLFAALPLELSAAAAHEHTYTASEIQNEYLEVRLDGDRHVLYTTGGDPDNANDDNKKLLYNATSKAIINIDGYTFVFSPVEDFATSEGDSLYSYMNYGDVKIERFISFSYNTYTARYDTVEYKYVVTNLSSEYKSAGARLFFDTMLGSNDGAPFRIAGHNVTYACTYEGNDIPQVWQVFDDLNNPSVIASGTFFTSEADRPDRVQFLSYNYGSHDSWDCDANGYSIGDSAVNVYFDPDSLAPGQSRTVKTYYGISSFTPSQSDPEGELNFAAMAPREMVLNEDGTEYLGNPFTFNGWVSNRGNDVLTNVTATLTLPGELSAERTTIYLGDVYPGQEYNVPFIIEAREMSYSTTVGYNVTITSDTSEISNDYSIYLPETAEKKVYSSVDCKDIAIGDTFKVLVLVSDLTVDSIAIVPQYDYSTLELVAIEWLVDAPIQDADVERGRAISAWAEPTALDGEIVSLKFRAINQASYASVSTQVLAQTNGSVEEHYTPTDNFEIAYCAHRNAICTAVDQYYHNVYCESCGFWDTVPHAFDNDEDTYCEDCGYSNYMAGDMNNDGWVDYMDAELLLMHVFFPDLNPIERDGDVNRDGVVNSDDAVYLQLHVYYPSEYPLY